MNKRPENYSQVQLSWSRSRGVMIQRGAHDRVLQCAEIVRERKLLLDDVMVIGPQHGFELDAFRNIGVRHLSAIDCVPEFVEDCLAGGHECELCEVEKLNEHTSTERNFFTSHALEHCYDLPRAIKNIVRLTKQWAFVAVPVEPGEVKDKAHFSPIRDADAFAAMFAPLQEVWRYEKASETGDKSDLRILLAKL